MASHRGGSYKYSIGTYIIILFAVFSLLTLVPAIERHYKSEESNTEKVKHKDNGDAISSFKVPYTINVYGPDGKVRLSIYSQDFNIKKSDDDSGLVISSDKGNIDIVGETATIVDSRIPNLLYFSGKDYLDSNSPQPNKGDKIIILVSKQDKRILVSWGNTIERIHSNLPGMSVVSIDGLYIISFNSDYAIMSYNIYESDNVERGGSQ